MDCVFCKIISGEIPSQKFYEDDIMLIFKDISPKSAIHYLAVPKHHYAKIEDMNEQDKANFTKIISKIGELKNTLGLDDGYRLTVNQGLNAGQTVFHLHIHIMGGQTLEFPDFRK